MLISLFRGARSRTLRRVPVTRRRPFVPRLEALEERRLPSTLTVTNLADSGAGSLRSQVAAAAPGDTIVFASGLTGAIALGDAITLDRNLSVIGNLDVNGNPLVTLSSSGRDDSTDLAVNLGITASVSGLTFTGATEAAVFNRGSLTLSHVAVTGNWIGYWGLLGAHSGTVYNAGGTLLVQDSRITDNHLRSDLTGVVHGGGGIESGGYLGSAGVLTVANCIVANNVVYGGAGGGIFTRGSGTATITDSTISNNTALLGGGIYFGPGNGLTLANSTVSNNQVLGTGRGGGIYVAPQSVVSITSSTIADNNSTGGDGGGIYVVSGAWYDGGSLTLQDSTVSGNHAAGAGGGLWVGATRTQVSLANTIVAGNSAAMGGPDISGPVQSTSRYNLIGIGDGSSGLVNGTNGNQVGNAASPIDPLLGPLQNNGGRSQTMALLPGSPAIDAGDNTGVPATDQRGLARIVNGTVDIGAFESRGFRMAIAGGNSQRAVVHTAFADPLKVTVTGDYGEPVQGGVVTFAAPGSGASTNPAVGQASIDGNGQASLVAVANTSAGSYNVLASAHGASPPLSFSLTNVAGVASSILITGPSGVRSGVVFSITVTAYDAYGNVATGYRGTVHFVSSDSRATLPANYTFTAADAGVHTFSGIVLRRRNTQRITVTDTANPLLAYAWLVNVT